MRRPGARLWLLSVALLACGCGSVSTPQQQVAEVLTTDHRPRMTAGGLVNAANTVCAQRSTALAQLTRPRSRPESRQFFAQVATIERDEARSLAAFRPPVALEADYAALLAASGELAAVAERFHGAVVRNDPHERRRALASAERASEAYDRAARRLGLACRQSV